MLFRSASPAARDAAFLDVRDGVEYNDGHIAGTTLLPRGQIEAKLRLVVPDLRTPVTLVDADGRRATLSLHVTRNSGIGSRAEAGTLPTAGNQGYAEERVSLKYHYGRGQLTGPLMRAADSDKGAFERAMQAETKRIVDDLKRDMNRQDRKSTRLNSSHSQQSRMPSSA